MVGVASDQAVSSKHLTVIKCSSFSSLQISYPFVLLLRKYQSSSE